MKIFFLLLILRHFVYSSITRKDQYFFVYFERSFKPVIYNLVRIHYKSIIQENFFKLHTEKYVNSNEFFKDEGIELKCFKEFLDEIFTIDFELLPYSIIELITSRHKKELMDVLIHVLSNVKIDKNSFNHINICFSSIFKFTETLDIDDNELEFENKIDNYLYYISDIMFRNSSNKFESLKHQNTNIFFSKVIEKNIIIESIKINQDESYIIDILKNLVEYNAKKYIKSNLIFIFQFNFSIVFLDHFINEIYKKEEYEKNIDKATEEMKKCCDLHIKQLKGGNKKFNIKHGRKKQQILITFISPCVNYFDIFFRHLKCNFSGDMNKFEEFIKRTNELIDKCNGCTIDVVKKINGLHGYMSITEDKQN